MLHFFDAVHHGYGTLVHHGGETPVHHEKGITSFINNIVSIKL